MTSPASAPTTLDITAIEDRIYRYVLIRPYDPVYYRGPVTRDWQAEVVPSVVQMLCRQIRESVDRASGQPIESWEEFVQSGQSLFDVLFPRELEDLRAELSRLETPLLITTNQPNVLWECMHDGEEFLGLRLNVGRSLKKHWVAASEMEPKGEKPWRCLIVADPTEDLDNTRVEAEQLRAGLESRGVDCSAFLQGSRATRGALVKKLGQEYDIVHYTGHVEFDDDSQEYGFVLHDGQLSASVLKSLLKGTPIVFLNGCRSGRAVDGLTDAFLAGGARVVVGSVFDPTDTGARAFSEKFYELVLVGKTVGEAMRLARSHVRDLPNCGAAWACFVMYGDPSLLIEFKTDKLQKALDALGLSREDFDHDGTQVLQQAVDYAGSAGLVNTAHLMAAMIGGKCSHLRERLHQRNVPAEFLQRAFQSAFQEVQEAMVASSEASEGVRFSANAKGVLTNARQRAGETAATEMDLVRGLVAHGESGVSGILEQLGVSLHDIDPDRPPQECNFESIGSLTGEACTIDAWQSLQEAARVAQGTGCQVIGSPQLLMGLIHSEKGSLKARLAATGVSLATPQIVARRTFGRSVPVSPTVARVLEAAAQAAPGRPVGLPDLETAFVDSGAGTTGSALLDKGIDLRLLKGDLLRADGSLELSRFAESAREVLAGAHRFAAQKRHAALGRAHLLYGMLVFPEGALAQHLGEQEVDSETLADLFYAEMQSQADQGTPSKTHQGSLAPDAIGILLDAQEAAQADGVSAIEDRHILRAWLADGGGEAGSFLARNGVRVSRIREATALRVH